VCASVSHSRLPVTRARATDAIAPCRQRWAAVAGVPMVRAGLCSRGRVTPDEGAAASTWALEIRITVVFLKRTTGAHLHRLLDTPPSTLGRALLASCIIALAILAWTPAHSMPRTAFGGAAEHFVAWLGTATIVGLASRATALLAPQFLLPSMPPSWNAASPMPRPVRPPCTTSRSVSAACCWAVPWSTWRADVG